MRETKARMTSTDSGLGMHVKEKILVSIVGNMFIAVAV